MATATHKGLEVVIGPRLPDEDIVAIENVVQGGVSTTQQILRFRRMDANQVQVLAATREGQLVGYAEGFTLVKANGRWDIVSEGHVDM